MLISESYRELNQLLHNVRPDYGTSGQRYVGIVQQMMDRYSTSDILDYGCGKRTLEKALGFDIANYDPCISGFEGRPEPHDLVVCTDVLEHIEPDCLDEVLEDIKRCMKKAAFLLVATRPAKKVLADGRNAHLIQQPLDWWSASFDLAGFKVIQAHELKGEFAVLCE